MRNPERVTIRIMARAYFFIGLVAGGALVHFLGFAALGFIVGGFLAPGAIAAVEDLRRLRGAG